jgi:hypothetical protein
MLKKLKYILLLLPFVAVSCVDEQEDLGLNLVNQDEMFVHHFDGLTLHSAFFTEDSLKTANLNYYALGQFSDAAFGSIASTLYTQLSLPAAKDFSDTLNMKIDSVIFCLRISDAITADTSSKSKTMHVEIRELSDEIKDTSYAFDTIAVESGVPLFDANVVINPDTIFYIGDTTDTSNRIQKQLRLTLSSDFVSRLKQQSFANNTAFQQWFKGICLKITTNNPSDGMIAQFNVTDSKSGIMIYYRDASNKPLIYSLIIDKNSKRFAHISKNFSSSTISQIATDTLQSENYGNKIYVGGLGVAMARISIDSLIEWYRLDTINYSAINQAVLILPVAGNNPSNSYPSILYCAYNEDNVLKYIEDLTYSSSYFGGLYDRKTNSYRMRITQYLSKCIKGRHPKSDMYIFVASRQSFGNRVILSKPRIEITYSH